MDINIVELAQRFSDEDKARELLESVRWPNGVACPHCGSVKVYRLEAKPDSKKPGRKGLWKCGDCRKQFTVTVGTIFEGSHIPLNKWVIAIYIMCASKKGVSALQLKRMMEPISYKSAWFMCHRIRHAMTEEPLAGMLKGTVEADETYIGGKARNMHKSNREKLGGRGTGGKPSIFALVERGGQLLGMNVPTVTGENLKAIIREQVSTDARSMTDEHGAYQGLNQEFAGHEAVAPSQGEYVRGDAHTNTLEGAFSLFKRRIVGAHHHVSPEHLDRYWTEFQWKYNRRKSTEGEKMTMALKATEGKRLMYKEPLVGL
jgi:transposase-like protein